jgi:hypothetical protein
MVGRRIRGVMIEVILAIVVGAFVSCVAFVLGLVLLDWINFKPRGRNDRR